MHICCLYETEMKEAISALFLSSSIELWTSIVSNWHTISILAPHFVHVIQYVH